MSVTTQLQMDFERRHEDLKVAFDKFGEAATRLAEASAPPAASGPDTTDADAAMKVIRKHIHRLIGTLVDQTGLDFHTLWVLAYHEHYRRTGFHAVAASRGEGKHLDAVAKAGLMPELKETILGMLTRPEYNKGANK